MARRPRLSPKRKKNISRKVRERKTQYYAGDIASERATARGEVRSAQRAGKREQASLRGASQMAARAVGNISAKGLSGGYARDVKRAKSAMQQGIRGSVPISTGAVRAETRAEVGDIRQASKEQLQSLANQRERSIQTETVSRLRQARNEKAAQQEKKATRAKEKHERKETRQKELKRAASTAVGLLQKYPGQMPRDSFEWQEFTKTVAEEGVSIESAEKLTARLQKQLRNPKPGSLAWAIIENERSGRGEEARKRARRRENRE